MTMPSIFRAAAIVVLLAPAAACGRSPAGQPVPHAQAGTAETGITGAGMTFRQFETRRMGRLMAMDTDGDGRISRAEFLAGSASGKGDPAKRFARLDANGDGFADRDEFDAMLRRRFERIDADHDGLATQAERAAMHGKRARSSDSD